MKYKKTQILLSLILVFCLCGMFGFSQKIKAMAPNVVINELQVDGKVSNYEEFIELSLIGESLINLNGWTISVKNYSDLGESECTKAKPFILTIPDINITPGKTVLIASQKDTTKYFSDYNPDLYYLPCSGSSSVLAADKVVRLYNTQNELMDEVYIAGLNLYADKNPICYEPKLATGVSAPNCGQIGQSFQRKLDATNGFAQNTNNNTNDFEVLLVPSPGILPALPIQEEPEPSPTPTPETEPTPEPTIEPSPEPTPEPSPEPTVEPTDTTAALPILLNELFIDPDSPLTDANDEWVELYNPNSEPVNLKDYTVFTGANFTYHYTFANDTILEPNNYISVTSGESSLSLANSGGAAKIVGPSGQTFSQTTYQSAEPGTSWAKNTDGTWVWTATSTKDAANIIASLPVALKKAAASVQKSTKTTAAAKPKAVAVKKSTAKKAATTKVLGAADAPDLVKAPAPIPIWLLAPLGVLAVLYACYEYRYEISNKIYQLKQYRTNSRANR